MAHIGFKAANLVSNPEWTYQGNILMGRGITDPGGYIQITLKGHGRLGGSVAEDFGFWCVATPRGSGESVRNVQIEDSGTVINGNEWVIKLIVIDETASVVANCIVDWMIYLTKNRESRENPWITAVSGDTGVTIKLDQ